MDLKTIYAIGHSTRSLEELVQALNAHGIELLVDVRRFPQSKHNPQFNKQELEQRLPVQGIEYYWMGELLGGFRKGGYEEFMKTSEFGQGIEELEKLAREKTVCIMCAESLWWKCHRARIARRMHSLGFRVVNIFDEQKTQECLPFEEFQQKIKPVCERN